MEQKKHEKEVYYLTDLIPEIWDINDYTLKNIKSYEKELQRIDKSLRGTSDFDKTRGILKQNKDKYVRLVKDIVANSEIKKIITKVGKRKELTELENTLYMEFMMEHEDNQEVKEKIADTLEIEKTVKKIHNEVNHILHVLCNYFDTDSIDLTKIAILEYEAGISSLSKKIKEKCEELDIIDDMRYEEKLRQTFSVYGEKHIKKEKQGQKN